jgi:hypothetical protein
MKPGHIRVFDGLRVTTEHMEHLQGSLHSALEDLRTILGLGRVHYGFEVEAEGDNAVVVHPGLAFDRQKNRIVLDEPKSLPVSFAPGEESRYVCVRYDQIEDGQVGEQYTLIWDTCAVALRPDAPEPDEDFITIARLDKTGDAFDVVSLTATESDEEGVDEEPVDEGEGEVEEFDEEAIGEEAVEEEAVEEETATTAVAAGEASPARTEDGRDRARVARPEVATERPAPFVAERPELNPRVFERLSVSVPRLSLGRPSVRSESREPEAPAVEEAPPPHARAGGLRVRQGVVRLAPDNDAGDYLGALIAEPLRKKLSAAKEGADAGELTFTLSARDVELEFPPAGLTCHTLIKLGLESGGEGEAAASAHSAAEGEATFAEADTQQFGLSMIYAGPRAGAKWSASPVCELTERGVAHLPLGLLAGDAGRDGAAPLAALLGSMQLHARVARADGRGFRVLCSLTWAGTISEEVIKEIENRKPRLTWETLVAWKALGDPFAGTR